MTTKTIAQLEAEHKALVVAAEALWTAQPPDHAAQHVAWKKVSTTQAAITRAKHLAADPEYKSSAKKLTVATQYGTFSRRTPRAYTHLIVVRETEVYRQRSRALRIAAQESTIVEYTAMLPKCDADGTFVEDRGTFNGKPFTTTHNYREYIEHCHTRIAQIREDAARPRNWFAYRWSQSLRNAVAAVRSLSTGYYKPGDHEAHIYEVATGKEVM